MICHLDVDVVRGNRFRACPALVDDLDQFLGDVDTKPIVPSILEPPGQLVAGVVVENIHVELSLFRQPSEGEVAASQVAYLRVERVLAEEQIELGVEGMAEKQLDHELTGCGLGGQSAKSRFVFIGGKTDHELVAEFLGQLSLENDGCCLVYLFIGSKDTQGRPELVLGRLLHPDQEPAAVAVTTGPLLDKGINLPRASQIEVADAKVRPLRQAHRVRQGSHEMLLDVIENLGHPGYLLQPSGDKQQHASGKRSVVAITAQGADSSEE